MGVWKSYRLHLTRRRLQLRALRKRRELTLVSNRLDRIGPQTILGLSVMRNERVRLPYFLDYYRKLGVGHFLIVDNNSEDGSRAYLERQEDVTLWSTAHGYGNSRHGIDWLNAIAAKHAHDHWTLTADVDEFLVFPFCDTRPLRALTDWLDASGRRSFGTMLLDMYPKGPVREAHYHEGQNPFEVAAWFDSGNYMIRKNHRYGNLWIQGGPRARAFFGQHPELSPALNKIPLVRWDKSYVWVSSTHMLLPSRLNRVYDRAGGEQTSGCLLHAKFVAPELVKLDETGEHFDRGREHRRYAEGLESGVDLWTRFSEKYLNWRQLEVLGLMSKGNWV